MGKKPRILVIDDDPFMLSVLRVWFNHCGLEVVSESNGTNGLQAARQGDFDIILSDIELPDICGLEVCRRLKQDPSPCRTPIMLMSGSLAEDYEELAHQAGAVEFLSKPFEPADVLVKISANIGALKE